MFSFCLVRLLPNGHAAKVELNGLEDSCLGTAAVVVSVTAIQHHILCSSHKEAFFAMF